MGGAAVAGWEAFAGDDEGCCVWAEIEELFRVSKASVQREGGKWERERETSELSKHIKRQKSVARESMVCKTHDDEDYG